MASITYTATPWLTTASTSTNYVIWTGWNSAYPSTGDYSGSTLPAWQLWNGTFQATREQREAQQARNLAAAERGLRQIEETQAATRRAEELLLSLLTDEQAASYVRKGWFEVRGSRGGRWRIRKRGQAGNVDLMPETGDIRQASYCCHPPGGLPVADAHLAQMLHLVTDEEGFRRTANRAA